MNIKVIGAFTFLLLLSCQTKKTQQKEEVPSTDSIKTEKRVNKPDTLKKEEKFDVSTCIRGIAVPILKKEKFPDSKFRINPDGLTGTETTDLKDGDQLIITNGGCEYYVLIFRFETSRYQHDTTDVNFWASKMADLMDEITDGIDCPIDLRKGTNELVKYIATNKIKIFDRVTFEPGEISTDVSIDRIQKIDNKRYGLEIRFNVGPL